MTPLEIVLTCLVIGEFLQMAGVLYNTRKTNRLIQDLTDDPRIGGRILSNGFHGFILELQKDPAKQEAFFGLMALMGNAALQGVRGGGAAPKPVKLKGFAKILEPFINNPDVQGMVADKIAGFVAKTGEAGVKEATGGWG